MMSPALHATLVGCSAATALISAGVCLARNPKTPSVRLHALYGGTAAWWLFSMAMVAGAESMNRVELWSRLAQLGIGLLPGIVYHVNVAVAGLTAEHRRGILAHYVASVVVTIFCLTSSQLLRVPHVYSWGPYPAYSAWAALPAGHLLLVMAEVFTIYRTALRRYVAGTPEHARARAFHYGNCFAFVAAVDFLPAFGVPVYPFGFANIAVMFGATMFGTARYRLIEITPEIAAERILETMPDGLLVADNARIVRVANAPAARLLGCRLDELIDCPLASVSSAAGLLEAVAARESGSTAVEEVRLESSSGGTRIVAVVGAPVSDPAGSRVAWVWLLRDLTEQRAAEAEKERLEGWVRHTHKMESLGVMAGGIAHDFNNFLMAILGSADIARSKLTTGAPVDREIHTIAAAAEQAAELTDQLLTYAGRGTSLEGPVDLNALSREMSDLIRSAVSRKARLDMDLADAVPMILGDRSQIRQVILNLVTNASDALVDADGTITVRTSTIEVDEEGAASEGQPAQRRRATRARLQVIDTGAGMDAETQAKVFDPFFTTKFAGRGLGLAPVLRIVQAHHGVIGVTSSVGAGTTFDVEFPVLESTAAMGAPVVTGVAGSWTGSGRALLADDDASVRGVVRDMLAGLGFDVVEASDGAEAVDVFQRRPSAFALVVLDMTMPAMSGREAAAAIRASSPAVPVVFMSGYAEEDPASDAVESTVAFLHKPFKAATLAAKVREAMAAEPMRHRL